MIAYDECVNHNAIDVDASSEATEHYNNYEEYVLTEMLKISYAPVSFIKLRCDPFNLAFVRLMKYI